jgi:hypothetical protein
MNPILIQGAALVLMLLALPLASVGTTQDATWAQVAAVVVVAVGGLVPPALRYLGDDDEPADDEPAGADRDDTDDAHEEAR